MKRHAVTLARAGAVLACITMLSASSRAADKEAKPEKADQVQVVNTPKVLNANDFNVFQESRIVNGTDDALSVFQFAIPAGKRLVIEFVSVRAVIGKNERVESLISGQSGINRARHSVIMTFQERVAGNDVFSGAQSMRMYSDGAVEVLVSRRDAGDTGKVFDHAVIDVAISGYLVSVP